MQRFQLTSADVLSIPFVSNGTRYYYDKKLAGFGVRVGKTSKTYFAESRVNGKTRRVKIGASSIFTAEKARKIAQTHLGNMVSGIDPNAIKAEARALSITLSDAAETFFEARKLKPKTEYDYRRKLLTSFADWQKKPLKDISPQAVIRRFNEISTNSGPASGNGSMRVFRSIWNFTRADQANANGTCTLPECPVCRISDLKIWNNVERRQTYLADAVLPNWFKALDELRASNPAYSRDCKDYCELILRAGLRRSEAGSMLWKNVNLKSKTFTLENTKNGKSHTLPMSDQIVRIFERRAALLPERESQFVFPSTGKHGWLTDPRKMLDAVRQQSGVQFKLHDLRRTFATIAERLDLSYIAVKRLLNHSESSNVTFGYVISDPERLRIPMQKISDEIDRLSYR